MKNTVTAYNFGMKSTVISIEESKEHYLNHIRRQVIKGIPPGKSSCGIVKQEGISYLRVYYDISLADKVVKNLKDIVSEVVSLGFKAEYLGKKMKLSSGSLLNATLINTMSIFDNEMDKKIVMRSIDELENINIDGLFMFRLDSLKKRWDEIIAVTGKNSIVTYDTSVKREFLRYLISSVPTLVETVMVEFSLRGYTLYDNKNREIEKMKLFSPDPSEDEELLYNLVCLAPQKVILSGDVVLMSMEAKDLIENLFLTEERSEILN